jgi:imidazolonepropionase-like amidohydrolase
MGRRRYLALLLSLVAVAVISPRPRFSDAVRGFIKIDAPVVSLTNVRVIDGTGAPARAGQVIVIKGGSIAEVGDADGVRPPEGSTVLDLAGRTVMPGLVMMHEHLFYPIGSERFGLFGESFIRLYLAGGVTTMRTAGSLRGFTDLELKQLIERGETPGPAIDATAPYLYGSTAVTQRGAVNGPDDVRRQVAYWADAGATSFKAYMNIRRDELGAAIQEAHERGLKITGHLCSVTYTEAADLGIDNLEHGFMAATDFVADKQPDVCPGEGRGERAVTALEEDGEPFKRLVNKLIDHHVALTSTLTVYETYTPGRPLPPGLDMLSPRLKQDFLTLHAYYASPKTQSLFTTLFAKELALERAFVKAGGLLIAGTDPTGIGGVVPGYANQRQLELLVEAGFTPLEAISIGTLNGAKYLGRDAKIGTIAVGKQADLVVVTGDPSINITDVRHVEIVFRQGVGWDPTKLLESVKGNVDVPLR